jgi:hypothetical protein
MRPLSKIACLLAAFIMTISLVGIAQAATVSFNVQSEKDAVRTIDLAPEDRALVTFTVLGETSHTLHFWIIFPNSTTRDYGEISQFTTNFASEIQGQCELHFENSNSSENKLVTLNIEVERYILGIPQMTFMLIVITVLLLAIVSGYVIMGKYS